MSQPATGATRAPAPPPDPQDLPAGGLIGDLPEQTSGLVSDGAGVVALLGTRDVATVKGIAR